MLLSVELCSLTIQRDDASIANLVASGLFGDGAAAVVMVGERRAEATRPDRRTPGGRHPEPVLSRHRTGDGLGHRRQRLPDRARRERRRRRARRTSVPTSTSSSAATTSRPSDIARWVTHPGGPKVLEAVARAARLPDEALQPARDCLATGRQPLVGIRAARPRRHHGRTRTGSRVPPACCWRWARASAPSWCSCGGDGLHRPAPGGRRRAGGRAGRVAAAPALGAGAGGLESGQGHYPAMVVLHTALLLGCLVEVHALRPAVRRLARLADARPRRRRAGAAVVVHPDPGSAVEHPASWWSRACRSCAPGLTAGCVIPTTSRSSPRASPSRWCTTRGSPRSSSPCSTPGCSSSASAARTECSSHARPGRERPVIDLLVAGGGPVGLAVAIRGRLAGLDVTVVEPRSTPVDKACGEGLDARRRSAGCTTSGSRSRDARSPASAMSRVHARVEARFAGRSGARRPPHQPPCGARGAGRRRRRRAQDRPRRAGVPTSRARRGGRACRHAG